jgi:hypothetical protein
MNTKMNTKNLMVSFCTFAIALFLVGFIGATSSGLVDIYSIQVDGMEAWWYGDVAVVAGETVEVEVEFTALHDASDVRMEVEIEGSKIDVDEKTPLFDVEDGKRYVKTLRLRIPYELKDEISENVFLSIKLWNGDYKTEISDLVLRVQRPSYHADIMSIEVSQTVVAGELLPVDVVLKNVGYNDLDDTYVTVSIPALGLKKTSYFGDIVAVEDEDNDDFIRGRFYLRIPYDASEGIYTIEAEASGDELNIAESEEIIVKNDFSDGNIIATSFRKIVATGEDAEYSFMIVNPTNQLKVYQIVTNPNCEVNCDLYVRTNTAVVAVPAGTSKTVTVIANAAEEGEYTFNANVLSGDRLEGIVEFSLSAEGKKTSPLAVLTVILAIVFLVLLVVLIVLLGKKPQRTEEFGESYY